MRALGLWIIHLIREILILSIPLIWGSILSIVLVTWGPRAGVSLINVSGGWWWRIIRVLTRVLALSISLVRIKITAIGIALAWIIHLIRALSRGIVHLIRVLAWGIVHLILGIPLIWGWIFRIVLGIWGPLVRVPMVLRGNPGGIVLLRGYLELVGSSRGT